MTRQKFSIVIPTRERADTLHHAIRTCLVQDYDECEIVVSDNYSADHTRDVVCGFGDPRIRYVNPGRRLSMCDNFEYAFEQVAKHGFVIYLGDDDGLMPEALKEASDIINSEDADALTGRRAHYDWPGLRAGRSNQLVLPRGGFATATRRASDFIEDVLAYRCSYGSGPILYQGFVSSHVLEAARKRSGRLFRSRNPDVYSAFAISANLTTYTVTERCLVIDGASPRSNGAAHSGLSTDPSEAKKFSVENNWALYAGLHPVRALPIVEVDAYLHAREYFSELRATVNWRKTLGASYGEILAKGDAESLREIEPMAHQFGVRLPGKPAALWNFYARRLKDGLRRWQTNIYIDCAPFGVNNIYGAAQLAYFARQWDASRCSSKMSQARHVVSRLRALRRVT